MKNSTKLFTAVVLLAIASCSKEGNAPEIRKSVPATIKAGIVESKTAVDADGAYTWVAGDAVSVFTSAGIQCPSSFVAASSGGVSEFTGSKSSESDVLSYALFPYDADASCSADGIVTTTIPTEQDGSIGSAISVAKAGVDGYFPFINACSVVKLNVSASDNIRYIRIQFASPVAGAVSVDCSSGAISGATEKTVSVSSATALSGDIYFAIAPVAAGKVTLYFRNLNGDTAIRKATISTAFSAGTIKSLGSVKGLTFIEGALPGEFTLLSGSGTYLFSKGNLRYQASTNTWSFADKQYIYVGEKAGNTTSSEATRSTQSSWIDMFCWGTSGYDYGPANYQPWRKAQTDGSLCGPASSTLEGNKDWGYNPISNGGNRENYGWTTSSVAVFNYMKNTSRTPKAFTKGMLNGVRGIFFLPDVWTCPAGVTAPVRFNDATASTAWTHFDWNLAEWSKLEDSGVVFFPCCGWIGTGAVYNGIDYQFKYWSKTNVSTTKAYLMSYSNGEFYTNSEGTRSSQAAVRLIYKLQ